MSEIVAFKKKAIKFRENMWWTRYRLKNKLTPYAADHDNLPIAIYLITKMDMEFRISLFENCMAQRDQKLSRFYKAATFTSYGIFGMQTTKIERNYYRKNP